MRGRWADDYVTLVRAYITSRLEGNMAYIVYGSIRQYINQVQVLGVLGSEQAMMKYTIAYRPQLSESRCFNASLSYGFSNAY